MARPLDGRRLLVTRRPEQARELVAALRARGADVVELPAIEIAPPADPAALDAALHSLADYDWLVLTSANTAAALARRLATLELNPAGGRPAGASVGPATSATAREVLPWLDLRLEPAGDYRAEGLLHAFRAVELKGRRVLLPLSDRARDALPRGLGELGARVDAPVAYRTLPPAGLRLRLEAALASGLDLALFASPSAVEHLAAVAPDSMAGLPAGVIGPVTERAARAAGLDVLVVARPSTVDGLLAAIEARFSL